MVRGERAKMEKVAREGRVVMERVVMEGRVIWAKVVVEVKEDKRNNMVGSSKGERILRS